MECAKDVKKKPTTSSSYLAATCSPDRPLHMVDRADMLTKPDSKVHLVDVAAEQQAGSTTISRNKGIRRSRVSSSWEVTQDRSRKGKTRSTQISWTNMTRRIGLKIRCDGSIADRCAGARGTASGPGPVDI